MTESAHLSCEKLGANHPDTRDRKEALMDWIGEENSVEP